MKKNREKKSIRKDWLANNSLYLYSINSFYKKEMLKPSWWNRKRPAKKHNWECERQLLMFEGQTKYKMIYKRFIITWKMN